MSIPSVTRGDNLYTPRLEVPAELTTIPWPVARKSAKICKQTEISSSSSKLDRRNLYGPYWCVSSR
jgi:hypothetical protein